MKTLSSSLSMRLESLIRTCKADIGEAARIAGVIPSTLMSRKTRATPTNHLVVLNRSRALKVSFCFLLTGEPEGIHDNHHINEILEEGTVTFEGYARVKLIEVVPTKKLRVGV